MWYIIYEIKNNNREVDNMIDNRAFTEKYVKKNEAARLLGVSRTTLDRYEKEGRLQTTVNERGRTVYSYALLLHFSRENLPPIFAETVLYTDYAAQIDVRGDGQLILRNKDALEYVKQHA